MSDGFAITVGQRYRAKTHSEQWVIPSSVDDGVVSFERWDIQSEKSGQPWACSEISEGSFRACFAPIAPDRLAEAEVLIRGFVTFINNEGSASREWEAISEHTEKAEEFLAAVEITHV